jgi:hypothetical protein
VISSRIADDANPNERPPSGGASLPAALARLVELVEQARRSLARQGVDAVHAADPFGTALISLS